ncbi:MAG: Methyltransferase type 12 [Chitinophagaceae bacterium]|nr:Methyltransferase type 12 [Chitinophagaceae bacterium]
MSSNDIYIDGTYFKNNPDWGIKDATWKAKTISALLKKNNISPDEIIDVGCGAGGILEALSHDKHLKLKGYDISPQAIALAKKLENENLGFYNEDITLNKNIHTDLLLVIDVLEHVDDFYTFLKRLKLMSEYFVFHIPLDLCCRTILKPHVLLQQRNAVGHIHYFTKEMVLWALKDKGYTIIDWVYTKPVIDEDPPDSFRRNVKKILRNFSFSINKDISAKLWGGYSMMILAK